MVKPRDWLRRRHHGTATTTAYTLLLGDRIITTGQVDARVVASAGYCTGLPPSRELRLAATTVSAPPDPDGVEGPALYVAEEPTEASTWRRIDDLTVEAYDDTTPALRFTSRSGQPLSSESRRAVDRTNRVLVITETETSRPRTTPAVGTWHTVVLLTAT